MEAGVEYTGGRLGDLTGVGDVSARPLRIRFAIGYLFSLDLTRPRAEPAADREREMRWAGPSDPAWDRLPRPSSASKAVVISVDGAPVHVAAIFETRGGPALGGGYTLPAFRNRGCCRASLRWMCAALRESGRSKVWVSCSVFNLPSRRAILAAGFQMDRVLVSLHIGRWNLGKYPDGLWRRWREFLRGPT